MRLCEGCKKEDRPWFEDADCSCGLKDDDDPSPAKHQATCRMIGHDVVIFPVRIAKADLTHDEKLPASWIRKGWKLMQNGQRWYRTKMLCRECVEQEKLIESRVRDYERACKDARGVSSQTYSQMLASQ